MERLTSVNSPSTLGKPSSFVAASTHLVTDHREDGQVHRLRRETSEWAHEEDGWWRVGSHTVYTPILYPPTHTPPPPTPTTHPPIHPFLYNHYAHTYVPSPCLQPALMRCRGSVQGPSPPLCSTHDPQDTYTWQWHPLEQTHPLPLEWNWSREGGEGEGREVCTHKHACTQYTHTHTQLKPHLVLMTEFCPHCCNTAIIDM